VPGRGCAVPVDALKIKTRLAQVESDVATLRSGRRSSLSALASVMGFEGDLPQLVYTPASPLPPIPPEPEVQLLKQAVASRPELVSQDHEIRASERLEESARKAVFPRIDLRASAIQYGSNTPVVPFSSALDKQPFGTPKPTTILTAHYEYER
jgi:outer membrane protein TolC